MSLPRHRLLKSSSRVLVSCLSQCALHAAESKFSQEQELARGRVAAYWVGLVWLARVAEGSSASARAAVSRSGYFGDIASCNILGRMRRASTRCFCGDPQGYAEGDPRSRSLLDAWAWLITVKVPAIATTCILKLPCGRNCRRAEATKEYVCYKPNPLIQIFYLAVVFGVIGIFIFEAYPYIPNPRLSWWHRYTGYLAMATALPRLLSPAQRLQDA